MTDFSDARNRMVDQQIARRGIQARQVLDAMRTVPREAFVDAGFEEFAYEDGALPISEGQTISQPYIVALMIEGAEVAPGDRVLDVGAGSGYSTALLSRIADRVVAIERHASLASSARQRLQRLGYDNAEVVTGDGTKGWPDAAPYDAILVAAGGQRVPPALREQLAVGGRLVIPVGQGRRAQTLLKVTRQGESDFKEENLGSVVFVPLIDEGGWSDGAQGSTGTAESHRASTKPLPAVVAQAAEPLPDLDDPGFAEAIDRFADRRLVLLGESTHGTSEFYRARAAITRRLVEHHGFTMIALEADWPDAAAIDRYVRDLPADGRREPPFQRFPTWMWRNAEVDDFIEWLRQHNASVAPERRASVHGLDIYNMRGSIAAVLAYLDRVDPEAAEVARQRYGCLTPWQNEPSNYGRAVLTAGYRECEDEAVAQCRALLEKQLEYTRDDPDRFLDATQNARLVAAAERYYRIMYYGGPEAWNLRDQHMFDTLGHLLTGAGPDAKAVVWAHNSHIGDARFTDMGVSHEELNLGQLCRQRHGDAVALIGFGTHAGTVAAASAWDGEMEVKPLRPSLDDSLERICHDSGAVRFLLDLHKDDEARYRLLAPLPQRFVGVIYQPATERTSHYASASLPRQFDGYVWFDETSAVTPLAAGHTRAGVPDTYPFGL